MSQGPNRFVRVINLVFFALGVAALIWMVRRIGTESIANMIRSVGWWAVPMLGLSLTTLLLNTAAIRVFMRPEQRMISYWRVLVAQLSGQAVNSVTPTGTIGEVLKVTMLMGHAPRYRAASSIIAFNVSVIFTNAGAMLFAIALSLFFADFPDHLNWLLRVTFALLLLATLGTAYLIRGGFVFNLTKFANKLHILSAARKEKIHKRLKAFDDQLRMFGPKREANYTAGFVYVVLARMVGWFDLWLVLHALGIDQGPVFVVMAAAIGVLIDSLASIVPLGIGAKEGGQAGLFELLGAGAMAGLSLSLVSRIRILVIAALGLLVMFSVQTIDNLLLRLSRKRVLERNRHRVKASDGVEE